ncbi:MAG: hypothetical protein IKK75_09865 [Clostridia bacterium]|nr:hypothetical protein [Clostridia bacterium]
MKILRKLFLILCLICFTGTSLAAGTQAPLTKRLSTRTGPSTDYTEPGTFFSNNWSQTTVRVLSKAQGNGIWWVQVEFSHNGKLYRAYTGEQRVRVNMSLIPEEQILGHAQLISHSAAPYYGPGYGYAPMGEPVPFNAACSVIASENGWVQLDYYDYDLEMQRRAWLPQTAVDITWYGRQPDYSTPGPDVSHPAGRRFYWTQNNDIWVEVNTLNPANSYSSIELHIEDNAHFSNVNVYMYSDDYGIFLLPQGMGDIWFYSDRVMLDLYLPSYGLTELMEMSAYSYRYH